MNAVDVPHIPGQTADTKQDVFVKAKELGYPLLIRPSYVIGGQGMLICTTEEELSAYLNQDETVFIHCY